MEGNVTATLGIIDMSPGGRWMSLEEYNFQKNWMAYLEQQWLRKNGLGWLSGPDLPKPKENETD